MMSIELGIVRSRIPRAAMISLVMLLAVSALGCPPGSGTEVLLGGPAVVDSCESTGSILVNCGFSSGVAVWEINAESFDFIPDEGWGGAGSIELRQDSNDPNGIVWVTQCVLIEPNRVYNLEASVRISSGQPTGCVLNALPYYESNCTGGPYGGSGVFQLFSPTDTWSRSPTLSMDTTRPSGFIGPDNQSARFSVSCWMDSPAAVRIDSVYAGS
jgi:hypothetical protein